MMYKNCVYCGKQFRVYPRNVNKARFCSTSCSGKWIAENTCRLNLHVSVICENCGKEFAVHRFRKDTAKYCSKHCHYEARKGTNTGSDNPCWKEKLERICKQCGKKFYVRPSEDYRVYCSQNCYGQWLSENHSGENHHQWLGRTMNVCENCEEEFEVSEWNSDQKFCCRQCRVEFMKGENAPGWKGGLSFGEYSLEFNEKFREQIRQRDNRKCAVCRLDGISVHHIDYDKINTVSENCITLCRPCHGKTNINREYWQTILSDIMVKRAGGEYTSVAQEKYE